MSPRVGQWWYEVVVDDLAVDYEKSPEGGLEETCDGPPEFGVLIALHFPHADLPVVLERLRQFNRELTPTCKSEQPAQGLAGW